METWLLRQSGTEMRKMLVEKMKSIKQTFVTWTAKFDSFFRGLIERSKRSLYDLFNRNHGPFFEHNSHIFIQLYSDLRSHYRSDELNLEEVIDRFFMILLQRMFSMLNEDLELTEEYLQCVAEHMELLRPFNEVPDRMYSEIKRSFLAARTFVQGLSQGKEIILTMAKQTPDDECSKTMARMLFCQFCQGHSSARPCFDYCVTTVGHCLGQHIELQDDWTNYLRDLLRVADRLADPFNYESVVRRLDVKISEAVMSYHENSVNVTKLVIQNCGNPPTKTRQRRELKRKNATLTPPEFIPSSASSQSSSFSPQSSSSSLSPISSSSSPSTTFSSSSFSSNSSLSSSPPSLSFSSSSSSLSSFLSSSSSPSSSDSSVSSPSPTTRDKSEQRQQQRKQQRQRQQQRQREGQQGQREEEQRLQHQRQPEQREEQHEEPTQRQPVRQDEHLRQEHGQPEQQEEQRREEQNEDLPRRQQQQREEQPRQSKQQKEQRRQQRQRERLQEEQRRQQQEELARQQQLYDEQQRQPLLRQSQESDQYIEQPPVEQQQQQQRQRVQQNKTDDSQQNRKQREPGQPRQRQQTKQQQRQQRPAEAMTELEVLLKEIRRKLEAVRTFWAGLPLSICGDVIADSNNETTCWNGIDLSRREGVADDRGNIREPVVLTSITRQQVLKLKVVSDKLRQAYNGWSENDFDGSGNGLDFGSGTEVETPAPSFDEIRTNPPEIVTSAKGGATKTFRLLTSGSRRTRSVTLLVPVLLSLFVFLSH